MFSYFDLWGQPGVEVVGCGHCLGCSFCRLPRQVLLAKSQKQKAKKIKSKNGVLYSDMRKTAAVGAPSLLLLLILYYYY